MKIKISAFEWVKMFVGCAICALAVYYLMLPANFILGSIVGPCIVIAHFIPVSISGLQLAMNIALLILGFLLINKDFGGKTVITSIMQPVIMWGFEIITPNPQPLTDNIIVNVLSYLVILAVGQTILFNMNASSGGIDVIAKIINKYMHLSLAVSMMVIGLATSLVSVFIYDKTTVVVGLLGTFFGGIILDYFLSGFNIRKKVCIISEEHEQILKFITEDLYRGATIYHSYGGATDNAKKEINTILANTETAKLIEYVNHLDPHAFITVYNVAEVVGNWEQRGMFAKAKRAE